MPSINLLPEDFTIDSYKKREKIFVFFAGIFFIIVSVISFAVIEVQSESKNKELEDLDSEIMLLDAEIVSKINNSNLFGGELSGKDIDNILNNHIYLSNGMDFLSENIIKDFSLEEASFSIDEQKNFVLEMSGFTDSYETAFGQIAILKDSFWVEDSEFLNFSANDMGFVELEGTLVLNDDLFKYNEQYWSWGIGFLANNVNRYIRVKNYDVELKAGEGDDSEDIVMVTFSGLCYSLDELLSFQEKIESNFYVDKLDLSYSKMDNSGDDVYSFKGKIFLKYY